MGAYRGKHIIFEQNIVTKFYHYNICFTMKHFCFVLFLVFGLFHSQLRAQTPELSAYGGKVSMGVSILDGFGIPVRFHAGNSHILEAGAYMGGIVIFYNDDLQEIRYEPMLGAGYTFMGDRFLKEKKRRDKIRSHGICLRVNQLLGDYSTTIPSLSWAQETFREGRTNRSFTFELGLQYLIPNFEYFGEEYASRVGVRLRCQWNFYLKK